LQAWLERMKAREGVKRGFDVPEPRAKVAQKLTEEEMKKKAEETRAWVQSGMASDAKK
jgi:glutathione S-transferase